MCDSLRVWLASQRMSAHHLSLSPGKTLLLLLPGKASLIHNLSINIESSVVSMAGMARNLSVTRAWPAVLRCQHHCNNPPHPHLQIHTLKHQEETSIPHSEGHGDLSPGSRWADLPAWSSTYASPLHTPHRLPVDARIWVKSQVLAYSAASGSGPSYVQTSLRL